MLYLVVIAATVGFAYYLTGGNLPSSKSSTYTTNNPGTQEIVFQQTNDPSKKNLQLQTFTVKNACVSKIAVDFLIDVSGSMRSNNKIEKEKEALRAFTAKMTNDSVIGIQTFSDTGNIKERLPLSYFKDVKRQVESTINGLSPLGGTHTRSGFELANQKLADAINQNKFPGYKYNLVFLSDGIPEMAGATDCVARSGTRCFARAQDPREPINIPQGIKGLGVDIYSIAIISPTEAAFEVPLKQLFRDVSSDPDSSYFYESADGENLTNILNSVFTNICN